jgi:hypothetical protein
MEINTKELKKDLKINENNLQGEWSKQAGLYMHYGEGASLFKKLRDDKKRKLFKKFVEENKEKPLSESALTRMVDKNAEVIEFQYQLDMYRNAVWSFEQKKKALESETQLLIGGFFAEPKNKRKGG